MQYGKAQVFGSKNEYIIGSVIELSDDRLFYEFCIKDGEGSYLRAVNYGTGEPLWTYPKRRANGFLWNLYKDYLICADQILDARTGTCLFDFLSVPGAEKKFWPFFLALDQRRLMFEMNEEDPTGRYFILDTHIWQAEVTSLGLRYAFLHEGYIYGWVQDEQGTELRRCESLGAPTALVCRLPLLLDLILAVHVESFALVSADRRTWLCICLKTGKAREVLLPVAERAVFNYEGCCGNSVYFSSTILGLYEYQMSSHNVRALLPHYAFSVCTFNGLLYGIEYYQDERLTEYNLPFALDPATGERLWSGPSLRNCNLLRVNERGVFVGIAGGKIHYFPAPGYGTKRAGKAVKPKARAGKPAPDLKHSPYSALLADPAGLQQAIQRKVLAEGNESSVVAVAVSAALGMAAFIEYDDDPDFPQLRLLDLQTDSFVNIDSTDLIDAPMIDDIAFADEAHKLRLSFINGQHKIVTLDLAGRTVAWD